MVNNFISCNILMCTISICKKNENIEESVTSSDNGAFIIFGRRKQNLFKHWFLIKICLYMLIIIVFQWWMSIQHPSNKIMNNSGGEMLLFRSSLNQSVLPEISVFNLLKNYFLGHIRIGCMRPMSAIKR